MKAKIRHAWLGGIVVALVAAACSQSDPGITTAVKSKLAADDQVKAYRIDVDTTDRVVTLTGAVDTPAARERALDLARNTEGVSDVVDRLTITPGAAPTTGADDDLRRRSEEAQRGAGDAAERAGEAVTDAAITSAVKAKFLGDTGVSGLKIDVDTSDGVVTLTGTVPSQAEKERALKLAHETNGVKSVTDRLKVAR